MEELRHLLAGGRVHRQVAVALHQGQGLHHGVRVAEIGQQRRPDDAAQHGHRQHCQQDPARHQPEGYHQPQEQQRGQQHDDGQRNAVGEQAGGNGQPHQQPAAAGTVDGHRQAEQIQRHAQDLRGVGRGLVDGSDESEAGQHGQQGCIGHRVAKVLRAGAGAERVLRLDLGPNGQVARRIPDQGHGQGDAGSRRQPHGQVRGDAPAIGRMTEEAGQQCVEEPCGVHAQRARPEGQRATFVGHQLALHVGQQPVDAVAGGHGVGDAEADGVVGPPGITPEQAGQDIDRAEQQRNPARQACGVCRGDQIGSDARPGTRACHRRILWGRSVIVWAHCPPGAHRTHEKPWKKKAPAVARAFLWPRRTAARGRRTDQALAAVAPVRANF